MLQIDSGLADLHLREADGDDVRLGDVWAQQTAVLVWLRDYR
jgi:hypothetical protein